MKISRILVLMLCGTALISCGPNKSASNFAAGPKKWDIKLIVSGPANNPVMKVNNAGMKACHKSNKDNGCMVFDKETGEIKFELAGHSRNYYITELKICMGSTPPSPLDKDCPLPADNAMDYYVETSSGGLRVPNTLNGKITWAFNNNVSSFVLHDRNIEVQEYYYLVKACPSAGKCAVADPILENKGMY